MKKIPFALVNRKTLKKINEDIQDKDNIIVSATEFVREIENGNLEVTYLGEEQSEAIKENKLASSLISMRNQMKKIAQSESERKWVTEGLAQFVDILRVNSNMLELSDNIIKNLVKYLNANQGMLLLLMDENSQDIHLQLTGCYAYDRKKYIEKRIEIGEGLAGQVILEKETIYITDIPQNYIKITSGLGEALPSNVLIVPLKVNETVYGVVEISSFNYFEQYQIEFVEKLSESIASSISSVRTNERTKKLLEETQIQTEQMRAQEEEMRQNMEELAATQEEMQRAQENTGKILSEVQEKEVYLNNLINNTTDSILAVDTDRRITLFNKYLYDTFAANGLIIEKGMDALKLSLPGDEEEEAERYKKIFSGQSVSQTKEYFGKHYIINSHPLRNADGKIIGSCTFTSDVTAQVKAQKEAEELLEQTRLKTEELQSQEEELRQNLEELSAIQEEMGRVLQVSQDNEAYMQSFINASNDAVGAVDKDLNLIVYNQKLADTFEKIGKTVSKGINMTTLMNQENIEQQIDVYHKVLQGQHFEATKQYGAVIANIKYDPIKHLKTGEIIGVCIFTRDVTEDVMRQRRLEEMSRELEIREQVFGLTSILLEIDSNDQIITANEKICKVSKYQKEELIGKAHQFLVHSDMPAKLIKLLKETIKSGEVFTGIIKNKTKDGSYYWVDATIVPIKDEKGNLLKSVESCYHLTDDKIALELYNKQAKKIGLPELK